MNEVSRIDAYRPAEVQELHYVQAPLAPLDLRQERLRSAQTVGDLLLRQPGRNPFGPQLADELAVLVIVDALGQPHIPLTSVCGQR